MIFSAKGLFKKNVRFSPSFSREDGKILAQWPLVQIKYTSLIIRLLFIVIFARFDLFPMFNTVAWCRFGCFGGLAIFTRCAIDSTARFNLHGCASVSCCSFEFTVICGAKTFHDVFSSFQLQCGGVGKAMQFFIFSQISSFL